MDRDEIEREAKERLDESGAFRRLGELISQIGEAMLESVEAARDAIVQLIKPIVDVCRDFVDVITEIAAREVKPKTIPPRMPVRQIGCRPCTKQRTMQSMRRIRNGCRHK